MQWTVKRCNFGRGQWPFTESLGLEFACRDEQFVSSFNISVLQRMSCCEDYKIWSNWFFLLNQYGLIAHIFVFKKIDSSIRNFIMSFLLVNVCNLYSSLNERDHVSHPCRPKFRIIYNILSVFKTFRISDECITAIISPTIVEYENRMKPNVYCMIKDYFDRYRKRKFLLPKLRGAFKF
jgi:hypothetical protein